MSAKKKDSSFSEEQKALIDSTKDEVPVAKVTESEGSKYGKNVKNIDDNSEFTEVTYSTGRKVKTMKAKAGARNPG